MVEGEEVGEDFGGGEILGVGQVGGGGEVLDEIEIAVGEEKAEDAGGGGRTGVGGEEGLGLGSVDGHGRLG